MHPDSFSNENDSGSGVRRLIKGEEYAPVGTLEEAKDIEDGYLIMDGDYGGQIYLTIPARLVESDMSVLQHLLVDIDSFEFSNPDTASLHFERYSPRSSVVGGKGGGRILKGLWIHPSLIAAGLNADGVKDVLAGRADRLPAPD